MTDSRIAGKDFLAHYGVPGMKWGTRKNLEERTYSDRKKTHRDGRILGGVLGAMGAMSIVDMMAKNPRVPKGRTYIKNLFKKVPPAVVPNPEKLNTANIAFRRLSKSKYGMAIAALGGFAVAASIGGKMATSSFDKDQLDPQRIAARNTQTDTVEALMARLKVATQNRIDPPKLTEPKKN
jgi:hypothetical protein